jgi:hypothetical protein
MMVSLNHNQEEKARQQIDLLLQQCGWIVQNRSETNLAAGPGVASASPAEDRRGQLIATVEAKPEGYTLTGELD